MKLSNSIKPMSYIVDNPDAALRHVAEDKKPLIITENGMAKAVLLDIGEYEKMRESLAFLRLRAQGVKERLEGKLHSASDVFEQAKNELAERKSG